MHDVGDGLLQAGFADPVMEAETITVNYESIDKLMADLRAIGANATAEGGRAGLTTPSVLTKLRQAYEIYRVDKLLPASYEVVYGHAWKPDAGERNSSDIPVALNGLTKKAPF
jgi:malonyl-CoA O-methyltransferase